MFAGTKILMKNENKKEENENKKNENENMHNENEHEKVDNMGTMLILYLDLLSTGTDGLIQLLFIFKVIIDNSYF